MIRTFKSRPTNCKQISLPIPPAPPSTIAEVKFILLMEIKKKIKLTNSDDRTFQFKFKQTNVFEVILRFIPLNGNHFVSYRLFMEKLQCYL